MPAVSTFAGDAVFAAVRPLLARHEPACVVLVDTPVHYALGSHEVRPRDGYRTPFGSIEIKKAYVSVHLFPIYTDPDLLDGLDPALLKRMQGKSCFNFKASEPSLFAQLAKLIDAGAERYRATDRL